MTISSTNRKAGPYVGNDTATDFPFDFKVFSASDLLVVRADTNGDETPLTLDTDFTVTLNANQDANPGGTVTLPAVLATGFSLVITSELENLQPADLTNNGGFYPKVINNALDRLTILIQQIAEKVARSLKMAITTPPGVDSQLPAPVPYAVIGWNADGTGFQNSDPTYSTALSLDLGSITPGKGASLVGYSTDGGTVKAALDSRLPEIGTYALLRAYSGPLTAFYVRCRVNVFDGAHGAFRVDASDTTSADNGSTILVDAAGRRWKREFVGTTMPQWAGAVGDGVTNDDAAFAVFEAAINGRVVDLAGRSFAVTTIPTGNAYANGRFVIAAGEMNAFSAEAIVSDAVDTGGVESAYTGGAASPPTPTTQGRTNRHLRALIASQNCRATFARSINVASIYSWAYGNVSGNYSARQCVAGAPQTVNIGSEECEGYGFRAFNLGSIFSSAVTSTGGNIGSRLSRANVTYALNAAANTCKVGTGAGARLSPTVAGGAVTGITITQAGSGYDPAVDVLSIIDRSATGSDATATYTVDGSGAITSVTVTNGGANYSSNVAAYVICQGNQLANVASELSTVAKGSNSGNFATRQASTTGDTAACIASNTNVTASASRAVVLSSTGSTATAAGAMVLSGNLCDAEFDGMLVIGRRTKGVAARSFVFGDSTSGSASTANRKFQVTAAGAVTAASTITGSTTFTDYAEYFENLTPGAIPLGILVALDGRKVRPTQAGDETLGVVSATALVVAGDSPFAWSKRYLTGEFGEMLMHDVECVSWELEVRDPEGEVVDSQSFDGAVAEAIRQHGEIPKCAKFYTERHPVENPNYDPTVENVPRSERPAEWTCIGLLGQVHVRVTADVQPGDYVAAGDGGIGVKSATATNMRCMEIRKPFNGEYAVGFCLIR